MEYRLLLWEQLEGPLGPAYNRLTDRNRFIGKGLDSIRARTQEKS